MTSFNLLNFKFIQIFLMGQNSFSKNDRIIDKCRRIIGEFSRTISKCDRILVFQKITVTFPRKTRFDRFFPNFLNFPKFFVHTNFQTLLPPPVEPPPTKQQGEEDAGPPSSRRLAPIACVRHSVTAAP
jgi:hypothetical protein